MSLVRLPRRPQRAAQGTSGVRPVLVAKLAGASMVERKPLDHHTVHQWVGSVCHASVHAQRRHLPQSRQLATSRQRVERKPLDHHTVHRWVGSVCHASVHAQLEQALHRHHLHRSRPLSRQAACHTPLDPPPHLQPPLLIVRLLLLWLLSLRYLARARLRPSAERHGRCPAEMSRLRLALPVAHPAAASPTLT